MIFMAEIIPKHGRKTNRNNSDFRGRCILTHFQRVLLVFPLNSLAFWLLMDQRGHTHNVGELYEVCRVVTHLKSHVWAEIDFFPGFSCNNGTIVFF